jgi:hypothetical protein
LDVIVTPSDDRKAWDLADLLGRAMGSVVETSAAEFINQPDGHAPERRSGLGRSIKERERGGWARNGHAGP